MSNKSDGNQNQQSAKVVKLGLNISVSGDPDTDFEIVLDDKEQKALQSSSPKEEHLQCFDVLQLEGSSTTDAPKHELEKSKTQEVTHSQSTGAIRKQSKSLRVTPSFHTEKMSGSESGENSSPQETSIINRIKSTMEHFEKFSDHIKDIPRLRNRPLATSTPFSDKYNSKSESNLAQSEQRPRKFSQLYDYHCKRDYFKSSVRPSPPNLFLKPLPGEDYYYKRGIYTRFLDFEPYRHYGSDISLNKTSDYGKTYGKYDVDKYEGCGLLPEPPSGILKRSDSESGDRQSTSSADSVKDIKIYQSGGILIMQNFKENMDAAEKKEMSEFSAKLIENCNKLKMEVSGWPEDKSGSLPEESKKMVQFDLSSIEGPKSKSGDSLFYPTKDESSGRMESSESTSDCMKNKDTSPQGTSQSQDLTSLSTQENDSFMSNPPGMSPTYASSKKLEWDSGADVGYLNLDLTKENLSTIEKIVLKGLSSDGQSEENIVYEKRSRPSSRSRTKLTLKRMDAGDGMEDSAKSSEDTPGSKDAKPDTEQDKERKSGDSPEGERTGKGGRSSSGENCIGESRSKFESEESKSESKPPSKEISSVTDTQPAEKQLEFTDKSVNVNTLFENLDWQTPPHRILPGECHPRTTHRKHSPKTKVPKIKSKPSSQRGLRTPRKPAQITGPLVTSYFDMGNPKKVYKKVEASPVLNEAELSREVEEIIIDQRFKIKNVASGREPAKETEIPVKDKPDSAKEAKTKARPISASSSSNNTVLPKSDNGENAEEKAKNKFTDQVIQTSDYDRESVGVQAFASQVSSDCDFRSFGKKAKKQKTKADRENVNTSSKNIQAFGLNSSLPKQLEHPVGTEVTDKQNTKSTQFFGGPLNSLPNYHSNLVTKPVESCGRAPNVLKTKRNSDKIRVKEENEKNILANDKPIGDGEGLNNNENKENLITQKSSSSKRSGGSGKNGGESEKSERASTKRKTKSVEGSDDVSSLVLTSEVLKEHGDSIDRNIIQEKYFQSQLVELEKREMISRSTSMEMQLQVESVKEYMTTGCQYSPQSRGATSGAQDPEDDSYRGGTGNGKTRKKEPLEQYAMPECESPNAGEESFGKSATHDQNLETGDSLPSSTQTAHSWVPGIQNSRENSNGVGKARSFEYLPGHIYESSGNLREELPSETEQNLITSCSSDSDTARGTVSNDGGRDSEGRNTLILEDSTDDSLESDDRLKILDRVLEQLNSTVVKLWEKDAEVQSVTQSLFANLCVRSGSGDWLPLAGADNSPTEVGTNKDATDKVRAVATSPKLTSKDSNENEYSIACQTEEKSPSSDPGKFYEERKALEKRISEEKKCQIKWIENEIHHLNVLRELLERQNSPVQRKKKRSVLSVASNDTSKSEENYRKNICPRPVTPVYGCTISLSENMPPECSRPCSERSREREACPSQYGVAVSVSGCSKNWRRVVMLPVGVQVSLKDTDSENCNGEVSRVRRCSANGHQRAIMHRECSQSNVQTQYPSTRRPQNMPCTSVQTDLPSPARSKEHSFCLSLSDKSYSSSKSKTFERRDSCKLDFINEEFCTENENKTSNSTDPEFLELENDPVCQSDRVAAKNSSEPADLTDSCTKSKSVHSTHSKCQNCSKRASSLSVGKPESGRGPCQSNVYLSCNNSEEFGTCRCSKIQVQKSSNCTCHIIKIHGSRCCSPDRNPCRRGGGVEKKTENQSCQTETGPIVAKELIEYPEIAKATEAAQVKNACEIKVAYEKRTPVAEKLTCEPKVSYEVVHPSPGNSQGISLERKESIPVRVNTPVSSCSCRKKAEKQKAKANDHPRHYFLRIEEAEVDDSSEPPEEKKKSLEVVTVTVPVKRAGRNKIYSNIRQTRDMSQENVRGLEVPSNGCNCCAECVQHRRKTQEPSGYRRTRAEKPDSPGRPVISPECNTSNGCNCCAECVQHCRKTQEPLGYRRTRAEKPESPGRPVISPECNSYEDVSFYSNQPSKEYDRQEYYPDRNVPQPYPEKPVNGNNEPQCCEACNCPNRKMPPSREVQKEYDSHKKQRSGPAREYYDGGNARFCEDQNNRAGYDGRGAWNSDSRHSRVAQPESDRYNPEFYNYNKREFMTKSEIMKEEEEKRKVQQPSLQEYLSSNRPDFYNSAERRRQIITERAKERVHRHNSRMDCLMKMIQRCNQNEQQPESKRMFTTVQMREQTMKRYRKLPEVTGKIADERKKEEYRTNRLMADIFAKKLQMEALKGHNCTCRQGKR